MAKLSDNATKFLTPISIKHLNSRSLGRNSISLRVQASSPSSNKEQFTYPQESKKNTKRTPRTQRRLISISTSSGRWQGQWTHDYVFSLKDLHLSDLAEDGKRDANVLIRLAVQKHAGFGFSVDGKISTSFSRKCCCCFSSYCQEIDATFDVWVLPSGKNRDNELPEIGGSDPSVIYVQPGSEADLDSLIQETLRLATSGKDTCSKKCSNSSIIWQTTDEKRSYDKRWYRLLELKNVI